MRSDAVHLIHLISGNLITQAIYVAAKLGIADLPLAGPKSVEDLATVTETQPELLYRVLRAVASEGIFSETSNRFSN